MRNPIHRLPPAVTIALAVLVILLVITFLTCGTSWGWECTGLKSSSLPVKPHHIFQPAKTLWDWLQLLLIPAALAVVGVWFNNRQKQYELNLAKQNRDADLERAREQRLDGILDTYIDRMSDLIRASQQIAEGDEATAARVGPEARARTVTAIRRLDSERNASLLRFLTESRILETGDAPVDLSGTDLRGCQLGNANLEWANLEWANLEGANLEGAMLWKANLVRAKLGKAKLGGAYLAEAYLAEANLVEAKLRKADLRGSILVYAMLREAILETANLEEALVTDDQLKQAKDLTDTTMPDGRKFQGWDGQSYEYHEDTPTPSEPTN